MVTMTIIFNLMLAFSMLISFSFGFRLNVERDSVTGYLKEPNVACAIDIRDRAYSTLMEAKNACKDCPINDDGCLHTKYGFNLARQRFWPCKIRGIQKTLSVSCIWFNQTSCDTISVSSRGSSRNRRRTQIDYQRKVFGTYMLKYWDENGNAVYQRTNNGPEIYLSKNSKTNWKVFSFL